MNQMLQMLRKEKVFSLREVAYAILEADGTMSILKKPNMKRLRFQI